MKTPVRVRNLLSVASSLILREKVERVKGIERFNFTLKISNLKLDARFPDTFLTNLSPFAKSKRDPMKRKSC
jgi:hypothetical protein